MPKQTNTRRTKGIQPLISSPDMDSKFQTWIYILIFIFVTLTVIMVLLEMTKKDCMYGYDLKGYCLRANESTGLSDDLNSPITPGSSGRMSSKVIESGDPIEPTQTEIESINADDDSNF